LGYQFWRLLFQTGQWGAIDLFVFHRMVTNWFSPVSDSSRGSLYPPATFVFLFPLVGWLEGTPLRWFWAVVNLATLGGLIYLMIDAAGAKSRHERAFIALIPLAIYATGAMIGNGQIGLVTLLLLLFGIYSMYRYNNWRADLGALAFLASLIKPTISAPFGWIFLFVCGKFRHTLLVGIGYIILTLFASAFRQDSLLVLLQQWLARGTNTAAQFEYGISNLSIWLGEAGLMAWILSAALIAMIGLGGWVWFHRDRDLWLILGVTAFVARLWTYHAWYDDVLILLPIIALYRIAKSAGTTGNRDVIAGILFALLLIFSLAPGGLYLFPPPWNSIYVAVQVLIWLASLIFLLFQPKHAQPNSSAMEKT
jgi:hypothetical protein